MAQPLVKEEVHRLIDSLPDEATLEDLQYLLYARAEIEKGRRSAREDVLLRTEEVFDEFDLDDPE